MRTIKNWFRKLIFNLIKEDILALIPSNPPVSEYVNLEWVDTPPVISSRPKASKVVFTEHPAHENHYLVTYSEGTKSKRNRKECIKVPAGVAPEALEEYLLGLPEAYL